MREALKMPLFLKAARKLGNAITADFPKYPNAIAQPHYQSVS
jgi:hypothetical protein